MEKLFLILIILVNCATGKFTPPARLPSVNLADRMIGQIFSFSGTPCAGEESGWDGRCISQLECQKQNGVPDGRCAYYTGVCCLYILTDNLISVANNSYFVSPSYPNYINNATSSKVTIQKMEGVCEIRLEFLEFELASPKNGICKDIFEVFGVNYNSEVPKLCGNNTGHYVYLMASHTSEVSLSIQTTDEPEDRVWNIKIVQLECSSQKLAPEGCLQYFDDIKGTFRSFNFDADIANHYGYIKLFYAICLKRLPKVCSITLSSSAGEFDLQKNGTVEGSCTKSYLQLVPGLLGPEYFSVAPSRICGEFEEIEIHTTGPLVFYFASREYDAECRGFKVHYELKFCENH